MGTLRSAAAAALLAFLAVQAAEPVRVPGTGTSLVPPDGFVRAASFPGWQREDVQASIMVTELPAPAGEMKAALTAEALATRGMTLLSSSHETVGGRGAVLAHVAQSLAGTDHLKWMLVTGDDTTSVLVVAAYPRTADQAVGASIVQALRTTTWAPRPEEADPLEGLPFRVTAPEGLRVAGRIGNMLALNASGSLESQQAEDPLCVVGTSLGEVRVENLAAFAEDRLRQTSHVVDLAIVQGRPVEVAGLAGHELLADGRDRESGQPIRLYQVIVPRTPGYLILQGLVGRAGADAFVPKFRSVAESLRWKE